MTEKYIHFNASRIYYRVSGNGFPVILIHGFGEDGNVWEQQISCLKDHFQLIIPDLPGSGKSEMTGDMSIEGMADVIAQIISTEKIKKLAVIGHSMGGYISLALAEKTPELLSCFGLFHSSAFADSEEKKAARLKSIAFIKNNGAYEFLKTMIPGLFYKGQDGSQPSDPYKNSLIENGKAFSTLALVSYYQAMINRPDRTKVLKTFPSPVLFVMGIHDNAIPIQQSLQQCYLPMESHVHILRNSAHMGMLEETERSNQILVQFLQSATS